MTEWSFRETVLVALLEAQGHVPEPGEDGWADCPRCEGSWWIRRRAEMADEGITDVADFEDITSAPLVFDPCAGQIQNVSSS